MTKHSDDELKQIIKTVKSKPRMILYTDVIGWFERGEQRDQTGRDDLWAISTSELEAIQAYAAEKVRQAKQELRDRFGIDADTTYDVFSTDSSIVLTKSNIQVTNHSDKSKGDSDE